MDRNNVCLKDVLWVIGVKSTTNGKVFKCVPYVKQQVVEGFEELIDLTGFWMEEYYGEVKDQDIMKKYEQDHDAKALKLVNSKIAIKSFIFNHENMFKDELEELNLKYYLGNKVVDMYCDVRYLTKEEGSALIREINRGVSIKYCNAKNKNEFNL